jgi:hemoglobin-like flavoprotein
MASRSAIDSFHASLERALTDTGFVDRFYDAFIASSVEIEGLFQHANMPRLKRKLQNSLRLITQAIDDEPGAAEYLELLGRTHNRLGIEPQHFDGWTWALIDTVAQCDPEFGPDTEQAWRSVLNEAVARMQAGTLARTSNATA